MKKSTLSGYVAPLVEEVVVRVEQGFAESDSDFDYDIDPPTENDYGGF